MIKRVFLVLLTLALLFGTASCSGEQGKTPEESLGGGDKAANSILAEEISSYKIIYAADTTKNQTVKALRELKDLIKTRYNVTVELTDDIDIKPADATATEILVGSTNRPASQAAFADIKKVDQYAISMDADALLIVGGSDEAIAKAVKHLIDAISALSAEDAYFFKESMLYTHKSEYPIEKIMIGDREISDYTIVYKNNTLCKQMAEQLQKSILDRAGYSLQTMVDTKAKTATSVDRKLIIGETLFGIPEGYQEGNGYFVGEKQGDVYLYSSYLPMQMKAIEWITEPLANAKDGQTLKVNATLGTVAAVDTSIKVMSFNVMVQSATVSTRAPHVIDAIKRNDPDVLGVQEASDAWVTQLENGLSDTYARVGWGRNASKNGETTSIFYKKDKFTLVEWGTKWMSDTPDTPGTKYDDSAYIRIFTYALLERKADGERFMHINVHPEDGSSAVKKAVRAKQFKVLSTWINENVTVPFIVTGDMNSRPEFDEFVQLQKDINTEKTSDTAYVANKADTYSTGSSSMVLDYILLSKDDFTTFYYDVDTQKVNGAVSDPSDHCPVIVVCDLKKK